MSQLSYKLIIIVHSVMFSLYKSYLHNDIWKSFTQLHLKCIKGQNPIEPSTGSALISTTKERQGWVLAVSILCLILGHGGWHRPPGFCAHSTVGTEPSRQIRATGVLHYFLITAFSNHNSIRWFSLPASFFLAFQQHIFQNKKLSTHSKRDHFLLLVTASSF